jgi:hypothetical protein
MSLPASVTAELTPTQVQFFRIEAERVVCIREKISGKSIPVKDNDGNVYRWEYDLVRCGSEVHFREQPSADLLKFILQPATDAQIGKMLFDLVAHKPFSRGEEAFAVVTRDLAKDLAGCSGWAIKKICEKFRRDITERFFPDTAVFVFEVRALNDQLRCNSDTAARQKRNDPPQPVAEPTPVKTYEGKARVAEILHNSKIPHDREHCRQCREVS